MKRLLLLLMLFNSICYGELIIPQESNNISPHHFQKVSLKDLISAFSKLTKSNILVSHEVRLNTIISDIYIQEEMDLDRYYSILNEILQGLGYLLMKTTFGYTLNSERNLRYSLDQTHLNPKEYTTHEVRIHNLKYPLAKSIAHAIRPLLSRYGRLVSFSNEQTFVLVEKKENIDSLLQIINELDSQNNLDKEIQSLKETKISIKKTIEENSNLKRELEELKQHTKNINENASRNDHE